MSERDDDALDAAVRAGEPSGIPFDVSELTPQDVPAPAPDPEFVPDHRASEDDKPSPLERVRAARDKKEKKKKPAPPRTGKGAPGALVKPIAEIYTSIGMVMMPFDQACSFAVMENAENMARSLDALAQRNDGVKRALLALTETSAWGGVLAAHLPLLLVVVAHHGGEDVRNRVAPLAAMMNPGLNVDPPASPDAPEGDAA